ncbi:MAG: hypothetical protein Pg6A_03740 [Termitinemataceae bacterium]|nr:MAG: hypothetical protein Pg6A_03740 [Termitinemataceae bacterium]
MKKQLLFILFFALSLKTLNAYEFVYKVTLPSINGMVCGGTSVGSMFKDHVESVLLLPVVWGEFFVAETKNLVFSTVGGFSLYFEDDALASVNISLGMGIRFNRDKDDLRLTGAFFTIYPVYEFPFIPLAGTARYPWKFAFEPLAITLAFLPIAPMTISAYWRTIFIYSSDFKTKVFPLGLGDVCFTIGWYFTNKPDSRKLIKKRSGETENPAEEQSSEKEEQ